MHFKTLLFKTDNNSEVFHCLFIKSYSPKDGSLKYPVGKTVYIANVPPYFTSSTLKVLFSQFTEVKSIDLINPGSYSPCYLVCTNMATDVISQMTSKKPFLATNITSSSMLSYAEYQSNWLDPCKAEKEAENCMYNYDKEMARRKMTENLDGPDKDGWTLVTKKKGVPLVKAQQTPTVKNSKKQVASNFYRFQYRENKMKQVLELRKKFEEDKKRIAALKAKRHFRPQK